MTVSVTSLAYLGTGVMIGAPLAAILAAPDEGTAPAVAERRERWLIAGCLTGQAAGICVQIAAALRARVSGGNPPRWPDGSLLAIVAVLSGATIVCLGWAIRVLLRTPLDGGESDLPGGRNTSER